MTRLLLVFTLLGCAADEGRPRGDLEDVRAAWEAAESEADGRSGRCSSRCDEWTGCIEESCGVVRFGLGCTGLCDGRGKVTLPECPAFRAAVARTPSICAPLTRATPPAVWTETDPTPTAEVAERCRAFNIAFCERVDECSGVDVEACVAEQEQRRGSCESIAPSCLGNCPESLVSCAADVRRNKCVDMCEADGPRWIRCTYRCEP